MTIAKNFGATETAVSSSYPFSMISFAAFLRFLGVLYRIPSPQKPLDDRGQLCRELMEDIIAGGNFGRKNKDRARALNMLPDWEQKEEKPGKIKLLYRTLRHSALCRNPGLSERPVALFFVMIGKAIRYIVLFFLGKRPNLLKSAAFADQRRSIYERLRMFESKENL